MESRLPSLSKIQGLFRWVGIIALLLTAFRIPWLSSALMLNLAHRDLLHWSPLLPYSEGKYLLERAVDLGGRAGPRWGEHGHGQRARQILTQMESDAWYDRFQRWQAFEMGQQLESQGHIEAAFVAYQEAASQTELRAVSFYALYRLTRASDPEKSDEYLYRLVALEPATHVHWAESDQYELLGFDLDEWSVSWNGDHIPITFYWQLSISVDRPKRWYVNDWQYIQVQDRLYQVGTISNLLPNGGFEQDASVISALPMGYRNVRDCHLREAGEIINFLRQHHSLLQAQRNGYLSQVAAITGPLERHNGFSTRVLVDEDALYMLSGWMLTIGESEGYLGGVWEKGQVELQYWNVANWSSQTSWRQYSAIGLFPAEASKFRFLALQRGAGMVLFDNVLFCKIYPLDFAVVEY